MAKPHVYRRAGRWFCRLDHYGRLILAAGRRSPELAYEALREQIWPGWGPALPPARVRNRDATIA